MSLINEALKKAQRVRHDQLPEANSPASGAPGASLRRNRKLDSQSILLVVAGGAVLVVFSVVLTVYLINRSSPVAPASASPVARAVPELDLSAPSPVIVAPVITVPSSSAPASEAASSVASPPARAEIAPADVTVAPSAAATTSPVVEPSSAAVAAALQLPTEADRIQEFVDTIRVTGIRSLGAESKVLINDRVYRLNDIIDRTNGLKLIKVTPEALTFSDASGATYVKSFR